ncbi:MAG: tetratricopeptide repeat protein [Treponema sp.]|jgi:tetratricopeptide (TPR) repeat protein|nr:tetratricopeptide repeat protein [Treponema sp.]
MAKEKLEKIEKLETVEPVKVEYKGKFAQRLSDFIQKNRIGFLIGLAVVTVGVIAFSVASGVARVLNTKAIAQVEDFSSRFDVLQIDINNEEKAADVQALLDELAAFTPKHKNYAGARGFVIMANIYADKSNWVEAEKAWNSAAVAGAGSYIEPVALYNTAVAIEEQGDLPRAIEFYAKVANFDFPGAPRSQFAIGRLNESQNNKDAALEAYRALLDKWPSDQVWPNLAQSRIVSLSVK